MCFSGLAHCRRPLNNHKLMISGVNVTLNGKRELFGVEHRRPLVLALFASLAVAPPLLALAPKVGAAVHAGNVEDGDAFQGDAAEVQSNTIALLEKRDENELPTLMS